MAAEAEGLAQQGVHQIGAVGAGLAVEGGVGGHQGSDVRLLDDVAVGCGVVFAQGAQAGAGAAVEAVALGVVGNVVLDGGDGLLVAVGVEQVAVLILALDALDEGGGHLGVQIHVLGVGLLVAAPAGVTVHVDGGRIEVEVGVPPLADLLGNVGGFLIVQVGVPGRCHGGVLGVVDAAAGAVQGLGPPGVAGDALGRGNVQRAAAERSGVDRRSVLRGDLRRLLLQGHTGNQVGRTLCKAVLRILEDGDGRIDGFCIVSREGYDREHAQKHHQADEPCNAARKFSHNLPPYDV